VRNRELTRREAGRRPAADMAVATPAAAPGQPPLLRAEDLSFAAGPRRVHVADFSLRPGELVSLTGANGSGKSTLCRVLCGLVPYRGRISLDQRELASFDRRALSSRVALVAQIPHQNLLCDTVRHELELLPELIGAAVDPGRLSDVARTCGVDSLAGRYVETLSGGEARRVALAACAIVGKAPLWLLDEPEFGLDRAGERFLCEMVERHCRAGGAVLNVSHGNVLSALSCKEYGILSNGEVALGNAAH
jgi:energy-coupling factor transporter ATP-binding protein EcfA2